MSLGGLHSDTWKASVSTEESSPCHDHTYSIFFHNRNPPPTKKGSLSETTFNTESHGKISSWLCVGSYPGILWSDSMWNPCICLMKCYNALKCCAFWEFQTIQTTLLGLHWQPTPDFNYQINITKKSFASTKHYDRNYERNQKIVLVLMPAIICWEKSLIWKVLLASWLTKWP